MAQVLADAAETRSEEALFDIATWSSYEQFRRLLIATAANCGTAALTSASSGGLTDPSMPEMTSMLQSLGSPEALFQMVSESGGAGLAPVLAFEGSEIGPAEWVVRERFLDGFAPYPEYCSWAKGLYSNIPRLFGMRTEVTKEACACDGAPACEYRVRWFPDDPSSQAEYLETRNQVLTARLESLQEMVGDLVSDADLEDVLARIIVSAARTISAPVFVLALDALPSADRHVYAAGIGDADAERLAQEILADAHDNEEDHLVCRGAIEPASLRPAGGRQPQHAVLPTGTHRVAGVRALGRRRARLRRRARGRPPPGRDRASTPRPLEFAGRHRNDRRDGSHIAPRGAGRHRLRPRRRHPVRTEGQLRSRRGHSRLHQRRKTSACGRWKCRSRRCNRETSASMSGTV